MSDAAWHSRWRENRIGFHKDSVNPRLANLWPQLGVATDATVFVPLCGKSLDLHWLAARGHTVVGIELSPIAVADFFTEAGLAPAHGARNGFEYAEHGRIRIYCGDFFALTADHLGDPAACFDRAALIALPSDLRARYMCHLASLLGADCECLLVALDYPQREMDGPPFSVPRDEIMALSEGRFSVGRLADDDVLAAEPRFRERGVTRMREQCYRLTRLGAG